MARKASLFIGWAGGIYGIVRGIVLMSQPLYSQASSRVVPGQAPVRTEPVPMPGDPVGAALGIMVISLVFIGALTLLTIDQRELFTGYALALFALSLLSLPSFGWLFLPATILLLFAAILLWLPPTNRENSTLPGEDTPDLSGE